MIDARMSAEKMEPFASSTDMRLGRGYRGESHLLRQINVRKSHQVSRSRHSTAALREKADQQVDVGSVRNQSTPSRQ